MDTNDAGVVAKNATDVADKVVEKLSAGSAQVYGDLKQIVEFARAHAPDYWNVIVRQQVIDGWANIIYVSSALIVFGLAFIFCLRWSIKYDNKPSGEKDTSLLEFMGGVTFVTGVTTIIAFIASIYLIPFGVKHVMNPEYYAAMGVCKMVTGRDCVE
jgi:hypothetical protein